VVLDGCGRIFGYRCGLAVTAALAVAVAVAVAVAMGECGVE